MCAQAEKVCGSAQLFLCFGFRKSLDVVAVALASSIAADHSLNLSASVALGDVARSSSRMNALRRLL